MTFKFRNLEDFLVRKVRTRLAQWHHDNTLFNKNIWSVLLMDKCERKIYDWEDELEEHELEELRCKESKLSIATFTWHFHEFRVSPWPY